MEDESWFPQAFAEATEIRANEASTAPLRHVADPDNRKIQGWMVADYLLQHGSRVSVTRVPPELWWHAARAVKDERDLAELAINAALRGLYQHAETLCRAATSTTVPSPDYAVPLATILLMTGHRDDAEALLTQVVSLRGKEIKDGRHLSSARWDPDEMEERRDAYRDSRRPTAYSMLADLLTERSADGIAVEQMWRSLIVGGQLAAADQLAMFLLRCGRSNEAEQVYRDAIHAGHSDSWRDLAILLYDRPRELFELWTAAVKGKVAGSYLELDDAIREHGPCLLDDPNHERCPQRLIAMRETTLRDAVTAKDPGAIDRLVEHLESLDRYEEAEEVLTKAARAGEHRAWTRLARWLARSSSRGREAESTYLRATSVPEPRAWTCYAEWLDRENRVRDAERAYRRAIAVSEPRAWTCYANCLDRRGRTKQAELALRNAVLTGEDAEWPAAFYSFEEYCQRLLARGDQKGIEQIWPEIIAAGVPHARSWHARWLSEQRQRQADTERAWRDAIAAGEEGAWACFLYWLSESDREAESAHYAQYGLRPPLISQNDAGPRP